MTHSQPNLSPEGESAANSASLGTCSGGLSERSPEHLHKSSPLAGAGPGRCISPVQSRTRNRLGVILFWTGEVIAGLSILIGPFILLFLGKVYQ